MKTVFGVSIDQYRRPDWNSWTSWQLLQIWWWKWSHIWFVALFSPTNELGSVQSFLMWCLAVWLWPLRSVRFPPPIKLFYNRACNLGLFSWQSFCFSRKYKKLLPFSGDPFLFQYNIEEFQFPAFPISHIRSYIIFILILLIIQPFYYRFWYYDQCHMFLF